MEQGFGFGFRDCGFWFRNECLHRNRIIAPVLPPQSLAHSFGAELFVGKVWTLGDGTKGHPLPHARLTVPVPPQMACLECFASLSMDPVFWVGAKVRVLWSPSCLYTDILTWSCLLHCYNSHGRVYIIGPLVRGVELPLHLACGSHVLAMLATLLYC